MARIPEIERRLQNWARYIARLNAGGGNYAGVELGADRVDRSGYDAPTVIPIADAEADATDKAVEALEPDQRAAVRAAYLGTGSVAERARKMGVSLDTLYARVERAHRSLARAFTDAQVAADAERKRVEHLQRSVAPGTTSSPAAPRSTYGSQIAAWLDARRAAKREPQS
jgi:hypothetical protein